jgi:hypothetical protein
MAAVKVNAKNLIDQLFAARSPNEIVGLAGSG